MQAAVLFKATRKSFKLLLVEAVHAGGAVGAVLEHLVGGLDQVK